MKLALFLSLPLVLLGQQQAVQQDPDKARFEGQVLNSATGEPLRKTRLTLRMNVAAIANQSGPKPAQSTYTVTSDSSGKFEFANVDPGDYQLTADHDGFAAQRLGNLGNGRKAEPILLNRADRKTNFTIKMVPYGAIAGVLLDEDGDPIRNLRVSAMVYRYTSNGKELVESKSAQSNDLGEYRIFDLPAGRYFLKISPRALNMGGKEETSYGAVFYPGVPQLSGAIPQDLAPGQQLRGLSFNLRKARLATIRGKVIAPPEATNVNAGLMVTTESGSSSTSGSVNDPKTGKFEFTGIPAGPIHVTGDYILKGQRFDTFVPIEVGSTDIDGIELRPIPPADLPGTIAVDGDPAFDVTKISVNLEGPSSGRRDQTSFSAGKDGRLVIASVTPGRYRVSVTRNQTLYIKSIRWGTTDITDAPLDLMAGIPPRTELAIVLGSDGAELTGAVANEKSEPVGGAMVTLVPTGQHRSRPFYKTANADASGHFTIRGIAPGSYKVFAWDQVNPNAIMYDADFLRPYESGGYTVEIQSKGKHTADLKLIVNRDADDRSR